MNFNARIWALFKFIFNCVNQFISRSKTPCKAIFTNIYENRYVYFTAQLPVRFYPGCAVEIRKDFDHYPGSCCAGICSNNGVGFCSSRLFCIYLVAVANVVCRAEYVAVRLYRFLPRSKGVSQAWHQARHCL
jgi:hypothetical protein